MADQHGAADGTGAPADGTERCAAEVFEAHRPVLFGVAYRMLGRVADAEDTVQDAWLRWRERTADAATSGTAADSGHGPGHGSGPGETGREPVRSARAFLIRVTARLALDRLRRARARRETYVGQWLPEPLPTDVAAEPVPDGADRAVLAESVSMAMLVVLESLSPLERAVFVLREAFGFPYAEIARALGRTEPAVRQLAGRARRHVAERRPRFEVDPAGRRALTERFLSAAAGGDLDGLLAVLAPDAELVADSGGKAKAPRRTIRTADKVGRFLAAIGRQAARYDFVLLELNGGPGVLATREGRPEAAFQIQIADGRIQRVHAITNPDKVAHLPAAAGR